MVESMHFRVTLPKFKSVPLLTSSMTLCLISMSFSFFIYKMEVTLVFPQSAATFKCPYLQSLGSDEEEGLNRW